MCLQDQGIRDIAMTDPKAIPPFAECTHSTFLPLSAQCPSKGLKFLQMMICSSTIGPCISAKPISSPRNNPHKLTTTSPSCSLTLRMGGFSIVIVHILDQALWRHLTMTLILTAPSESGTYTPIAAEIWEPVLADQEERRLGTTTLLAMSSPLGRSIAL